ncbi:FecR family protein [Ancylomarina sp. YFZ004]
MTNEEYTKKYIAGTLTDAEMDAFKISEDYKQISRLLNAVQAFKAPDYNVEGEIQLLSGNLKHRKKNGSFRKQWKPLWGVAATILLIIAFGYMQFNNSNDTGEMLFADKAEFNLPDSSFVALNEGSKLYYTIKEWQTERSVELKGEAFFKVKKGSKFEVETNQGVISVLGTEFNVKSWENYFEVTCYSGLVRVKTPQKTVNLRANSIFRVIDGIPYQHSILNENSPGWLHGESTFKSVPLNIVLKEFERQYKVKVIKKDIDLPQLFTGSFTHNNINLALESITLPINMGYKKNGNKITIEKE